jgi:hypothetical protein
VKAKPRHVALAVATWLAVATGAAILLREAGGTPEPMPRAELDRAVRQLRSDALEARTLALALATGQLTTNYAMQQHRMLADDLHDVRSALDKPPPRDGAGDAERARRAIDKLAALLESVPVNMADAQALRRIAEGEAALADELPGAAP